MKITCTSERIHAIREALPFWCDTFDNACILNSNGVPSAGNNDSYELIAGTADTNAKTFDNLTSIDKDGSWKLGYLTYEFNHKLHGISNIKESVTGFNGGFFFVPQILIIIRKNSTEIEIIGAGSELLDEIINTKIEAYPNSGVKLRQRISREDYIRNVEMIKEQILEGTFYELNYCMEFFQENIEINPPLVFQRINKISPTPFSAFFKNNQKYLICASPERFIKRTGNKILAQPIKGTAARGPDKINDELLKTNLKQSEKERAENIMIVDLMRNDLSQCAETGSVNVEELFGVYTFATVHQLISSVSATLRNNISFEEIIQKTFPMGSMTGAPKREVMHFIDSLEPVARGIFSGCIGYLSPENDFDLNVVIRSIVYNDRLKYLSCHVGSAITFDADASSEYEECLLKARTMFNALDTLNFFL